MTHYYCYIQGPVDLTLETKIFKVKVGENQRDQIKKSLLDCYAQDTDGFFRIWDDTTDYHLRMLMSKRVEDGRICFLGSQTIHQKSSLLHQKLSPCFCYPVSRIFLQKQSTSVETVRASRNT